MITIAVDTMSGDNGVSTVVEASIIATRKNPRIKIVLVGIEQEIINCCDKLPKRVSIKNATQVVTMNDSPALSMRNKKDSSMRVALNLAKSKDADAVVSAGNTGALMATSRFVLKMIKGINRPVLCTALPGQKGPVWILDLGANIDSSSENLLQYGLMGSALARALLHRTPKVGLLNVGIEEIKGSEVIKKASELLKQSDLDYYGYVEGDEIFGSKVDLIVCDGFVGNAVLKAIEGLASKIRRRLKEEFTKTLLRKICALFSLPALNSLKNYFDNRKYNGASLLGLNGVVIKSHGSADVSGMLAAINVAYEVVENDLLNKIRQELK